MAISVERTSPVSAPAAAVWARAVTPEGINHELGPWLRMTMPAGLRGATIDAVALGVRLGRSWILLAGLVPVNYDDLCLVEVEPGRRFLERSTTLSMSSWQHERVVDPRDPSSSLVTDRLTFELRRPMAAIPGSGRLAAWIVGRIFAHRHRRLTAWAQEQAVPG